MYKVIRYQVMKSKVQDLNATEKSPTPRPKVLTACSMYTYDTYKTDKQFYVDLSHIHMKNGKP